MNQSKKITYGAVLTAIYIVLLLFIVFVPFLSMFGVFVLPIPFIVYAAKFGFKPTLIMFLVALLLSLVFATAISLPMTLLFGLGGMIIGAAIYRKLGAYETLARGTLGFIVGIILILIAMFFILDINIYTEMDTAMKDSVQMSKTLFEQMGMEGQAASRIAQLEEQIDLFKNLIPASIAMISMLLAFVSQWLSYKIMNRMENKQLFFPPFKQLNLPVSVLWIYFIALIIGLFNLDPDSSLYLVIMNVLAFTMIFIAIQGFSFIFFYADHKKISKAIPITILVVSIIIPFLFLFVIRIIGIIDLGFSLKSRIAGENKT